MAIENRTGTFVLGGKDGRQWLFPNATIVAFSINDARD
jgi:hypothetical protein